MATTSAPAQKAKKLTISLAKKRSDVSSNGVGSEAAPATSGGADERGLDAAWPILSDFITAVHRLHTTGHSLQELYAAVEALVMARHGGALYTRTVDMCKARIDELVDSLSGSISDVGSFLHQVQESWTTHCSQMVLIRNVFLYMDRTYVRDTQGVKPLWDMGISLFRDALLRRRDVLSKTTSGIVSMLQDERRGEAVDRPMLSILSRMLVSLRLYNTELEPALLASTREYYEAEGLDRMASMDIAAYLAHVQTRLRQERDRVVSFMDASSLRPLISIVDHQLIGKHANAIIDRGFTDLVDHRRTEDLHRMYDLLCRVDQGDDIRKAFAAYTKGKALSLVSEESEEKDKRIVESLLAFRETMDELIREAFASNEAFSGGLKTALEFAVNSRENKPAELIAKHVDALMRGGAKAASVSSEEEVERLLDRVMVLFRCIHGKDIFEAFYKKDLAKRLLLSKSASNDLEKSMVSKLKTECGSAFTSKLEGMFKDMALSTELMSQLKVSKAYESVGLDLDVHVLTSSYWPAYNCPSILIPTDLQVSLTGFDAFYQGKYAKGRKLQWQHQLGHCILKANFPTGRKELEVSFYQALVLFLFNTTDAHSFKAIKEATAIEDAELRRTLQSLSLGKVRVLRKEPKGKEVEDEDVFTYAADFKDPLFRLKINTIQAKETKQEVEATHAKVVEDRQYQMDAAIVRIMKSRKTMTHQLLVGEVFAQLRFPAKGPDVKKRIESLIDRDYLERAEDDANTYHYLA